jgi:hypothetical protein
MDRPEKFEDELLIRDDFSFANGAINPKGKLLTKAQVKRLLAAEKRRYKERAKAACYSPHNAFVFYDRVHKPVAWLEVCLDCLGARSFPADHGFDPDYIAIAKLCAEIGLPFGNTKDLKEYIANTGWVLEPENYPMPPGFRKMDTKAPPGVGEPVPRPLDEISLPSSRNDGRNREVRAKFDGRGVDLDVIVREEGRVGGVLDWLEDEKLDTPDRALLGIVEPFVRLELREKKGTAWEVAKKVVLYEHLDTERTRPHTTAAQRRRLLELLGLERFRPLLADTSAADTSALK